MIDPTPKVICILGTTFTGKSFAAGWLAANIRRKFVVILHTHPDKAYLQHIDRDKTRFIALHSGNYTITTDLLQTTRKKFQYLYFSVYDLTLDETRESIASLVAACRQAGNLALFLDEAHLFLSRFQVPKEAVGFVRGARFYGVDIVIVSHRLKDVDIGVRCVITHMVLFRAIDQSDIDVLQTELDMRVSGDTLRSLPDRRFIFVNRRTGYISGKQRI